MNTDLFNLERFVGPQNEALDAVETELRAGHKLTHWMWFIFPQLKGLGRSSTAEFFGLADRSEAVAYLDHPVLGTRLIQHTLLVNRLKDHSAEDIFGHIDAMKFRSCMTLFASVSGSGSEFHKALDKYFAGAADEKTLALIAA